MDRRQLAALHRTAAEINDYLREEVERHRGEQPDDLLTFMLQLSGDEALSEEEILSTAVLLLAAGYDTTAKATCNCLIAFGTSTLATHSPSAAP